MENSVVSKIETTASDNKKYITNYYNLDAIISVGYRVNSTKATQFRIWATQALKEYINFLNYIFNFNFINFTMGNKDKKTKTTTPKSDVKVERPQSILIKNNKQKPKARNN